jgi:hypothetical protein
MVSAVHGVTAKTAIQYKEIVGGHQWDECVKMVQMAGGSTPPKIRHNLEYILRMRAIRSGVTEGLAVIAENLLGAGRC